MLPAQERQHTPYRPETTHFGQKRQASEAPGQTCHFGQQTRQDNRITYLGAH